MPEVGAGPVDGGTGHPATVDNPGREAARHTPSCVWTSQYRAASGHATAPVGGTTGAVFRAGSGGEGPVRALNPIGGATRLIVGPQGAKRKQLAREFLSLRRVRPSEVAVTYGTEALIALS